MTTQLPHVGTIEEIAEVSPPSKGWSHSGIVVLPDGVVVFAHPEGRRLVFYDPRGGSAVTKETGLLEIHGITLDPRRDARLWLADPGAKPDPENSYREELAPGRVVSWEAEEGRTSELRQPDVDAYASSTWRPTSVAVDSRGSVWVADGYGASLVHAFTAAGEHTLTLDGTETGQRFDCPHGILVCSTGADVESEVYIADRGNRRIVVYGEDGALRRVVTGDELTSPSCLAEFGGVIFVTELFGGLLRVDDGRSVSTIIPAPVLQPAPPWPNAAAADGPHRPELDPHLLHSPHGIAVDAAGILYLTEWCIGGRQLRLALT